MDINKINLQKIMKAEQGDKTKSSKEPSLAGEVKQFDEASYSKGSKATRAAVLAAIFATLGGVPTLTSCTDVENLNINEFDVSGLLAQLQKLNDQVEELKKQQKEDNTATNALLLQITNQNNQIITILAGIHSDTSDIAGTIDKVLAAITDPQLKEILLQIVANGDKSQATLEAMLKAIQENNKILVSLTNIMAQFSSDFSVFGSDLMKKLDGFIQMYNNRSMSLEQLVTAIFNEMKTNDASLQVKLDAIINGQGSNGDKLDAIAQLIAEANAKLQVLIGKIESLSVQIDALGDKIDNGLRNDLKQLISVCQDIRGGVGNIDNKMNTLVSGQQQIHNDILNLNAKADQMIAQLTALNKDKITKGDLQQIMGDFYNNIQPYLEKIGTGNEIDMSDVIAAIEASKVDLTHTNALIETLINIVQNLPLGGSEIDPAIMNQIISLLQQALTQDASNAADLNAQLQQILKLLGNIDGNVAAIKDQLGEVNQKLDGLMTKLGGMEQNLVNELKNLAKGVGNIDKLVELAEARNQMMVEAQTLASQRNAYLEAILNKEITVAGGSLSKQDIIDIINSLPNTNGPDYTQLLQEIRDKLGNVVTSADLQNFMNSQTDLTHTNALIETLINTVQNLSLNGGGGSADLSVIEAYLSQIAASLNGGTMSSSQIQQLIDALQNLVNTMNSKAPSRQQVQAYIDAVKQADAKTYVPSQFYLGSHMKAGN